MEDLIAYWRSSYGFYWFKVYRTNHCRGPLNLYKFIDPKESQEAYCKNNHEAIRLGHGLVKLNEKRDCVLLSFVPIQHALNEEI